MGQLLLFPSDGDCLLAEWHAPTRFFFYLPSPLSLDISPRRSPSTRTRLVGNYVLPLPVPLFRRLPGLSYFLRVSRHFNLSPVRPAPRAVSFLPPPSPSPEFRLPASRPGPIIPFIFSGILNLRRACLVLSPCVPCQSPLPPVPPRFFPTIPFHTDHLTRLGSASLLANERASPFSGPTLPSLFPFEAPVPATHHSFPRAPPEQLFNFSLIPVLSLVIKPDVSPPIQFPPPISVPLAGPRSSRTPHGLNQNEVRFG